MKLTLIENLEGSHLVTDADTGEPDTQNHQAHRPVRMFVPPYMRAEPTLDRNRLQADLAQVTRILDNYQPPFREIALAKLLNVSVEEARRLGRDEALGAVTAQHEAELAALRSEHSRERERRVVAAWSSSRLWAFHNKVVRVDDAGSASVQEIAIRVMHLVLTSEAEISRMHNEVNGYLAAGDGVGSARPRIPDDIRRFVWRRDRGRCAKCESRERLEFDHIIPLSRGGHNTARNIELLCEACNRRKGNQV